MENADKPAYPIGQEMFEELEMGRDGLEDGFGLTKRERFAMAAMQGCLAMGCDCQGSDEELARTSVKKADALLAELEKTESP